MSSVPAASTSVRPARPALRRRSAREASARAAFGAVAALCALCLLPRPAAADDRNLVEEGQKNPYLFIILDVSGSMHQSVFCTATDFAAGNCSLLCPDGDCQARMSGDDPASKLNTAKQAIYELMQSTSNVNFGFGTFDQAQLHILRKHWWYQLDPTQPNGFIQLESGTTYPAAGHQEVFGQADWNCTDARADTGAEADPLRWVSCPLPVPAISGTQPANPLPALLNDPWQWERARRFPKLDDNNSATRFYYFEETSAGPVYRVTFTPVAANGTFTQVLGANQMQVKISVDKCTDNPCTVSKLKNEGTKVMVWDKVNEFVYWEPGEGVSEQLSDGDPNPGGGAFFGDTARETSSNGNLSALDRNNDNNDPFTSGGTTIDDRQVTVADPFGRASSVFTIGDIIPLDWKDNHTTIISQRMAPNLLIPGNTTPDFAIATYFQDHRVGTETALRLKDTRARPLIPEGGTPTGGAMNDFVSLVQSFLPLAADAVNGDPNFNCKKMYMLLITDGFATDGNVSCNAATTLRTLTFNGKPYPIRTYAIGLGLAAKNIIGFTNTLTCVTDNGGTGTQHYFNTAPTPDGPGPILPQNKKDLVQALENILALITANPTSFAAAAVPSVQSNVADQIVISTFLPVNRTVWPGHVESFIKPLPLVNKNFTQPDGTIVTSAVPDTSQVCPGPNPPAGSAACMVWDAASLFPNQTATDAQIAANDFNLDPTGTDSTKRRVYYSTYNPKNPTSSPPAPPVVPSERDLFQVPSDLTHWTDLLAGMGVCNVGDTVCGGTAANQATGTQTLHYTHQVKTYPDPADASNLIPYILGDIFHSNPQIIGAPENFQFFSTNLNGYATFANTQRFRRKVLYVGSNDGQLHAFDAGTVQKTGTAPNRQWTYNVGTGKELFSYVPRTVMPTLVSQAAAAQTGTGSEAFMVDGTPALGDVFINPLSSGTTASWRTVLVGGLREGGRGYYALDVTQPDTLQPDHENPDDVTSIAVSIPQSVGGTSGWLATCFNGSTAQCGPVPFASPLWEFYDQCPTVPGCTTGCTYTFCDEDANGQPDLGDTWSVPAIGRVLVCDGSSCDPTKTPNNLVDKWVAIFGGGNDASGNNARGNFIYMVDISSGEVLYKRKVTGSVPSDVSAVDTHQTGYIDTLYVGTTSGLLYKVDVSTPAQLKTLAGIGKRVDPAAWVPFAVFDTEGRPIYYAPAVEFVPTLGRYALAFGTGNREDLWAPSNVTGRFYTLLDNGWTATTTGIPFKAANYQLINASSAAVSTSTDFLISNPNPSLNNGWFLELTTGERVMDKAFALSGVTIFPTYQPVASTAIVNGQQVCADTGNSRIFVVNTLNANPIGAGTTGTDWTTSRFKQINGTLASHVIASPSSKKAAGTGSASQVNDTITANLQGIENELKLLFPKNCRFTNSTINVFASRSDSGLDFVAPVPVCVIEKNWKEF